MNTTDDAAHSCATLLLLGLVGPLQSWSLSAPYRERTTHIIPTKSGVIGILSAAFGHSRDADLRDLAELRLHIRIDRPGRKLRDFQVAQSALRANGKVDGNTVITRREYLADAAFLAALEGSASLLNDVRSALQNPVYPIYLGSRCCLPSRPLVISHPPSNADILQLFALIPDLSGQGGQKRAYLEDPKGSWMVRDAPGRSAAVPGRFREAQWFERYLRPVSIDVGAS
ncbi:type I-E CRISPR-associated protein Cas5/CasD [Deinococcus ruber]|uniref:type I-E CRISPR-associated protein Cas5/CasD n=1 Tax=Deinococcus ruber TaxID=1848197 RepID=UPI0035710727